MWDQYDYIELAGYLIVVILTFLMFLNMIAFNFVNSNNTYFLFVSAILTGIALIRHEKLEAFIIDKQLQSISIIALLIAIIIIFYNILPSSKDF